MEYLLSQIEGNQRDNASVALKKKILEIRSLMEKGRKMMKVLPKISNIFNHFK